MSNILNNKNLVWFYKILFITSLCLASPSIRAADKSKTLEQQTLVPAQSLQNIINHTLQKNPEVLKSIADKMGAKISIQTAVAEFLPSAGASYSIGKERSKNSNTNYENLTLNRKNLELYISQPIFTGFSSVYHYKQKKAEYRQQKFATNNVKNLVSMHAIKAYLDILRLKESDKIFKKNINVHKEILNKVIKKRDAGAGFNAEVNLTQSRLQKNLADLMFLKKAKKDAATRFEEITGIVPKTLRLPNKPNLPQELPLAIDEAMRANPKLRGAEFEVKAAKAAYISSKGKFLPTLELKLARNRSSNLDGSRTENTDYRITLEANYNLFAGGADLAKSRTIEKTKVAARHNLQAIKRNIIANVTNAWNALIANKNRLQNFIEYEKNIKKVLKDYNIQFSLGRRSLLDLLDMENELFSTQIKLNNEKYNLLLNSYNLLAGMGKLYSYFN